MNPGLPQQGHKKDREDGAQWCMQYANYIPLGIAAQPFPYPEHLDFSVLVEGILYNACRCTVLQGHGMQRNKCHGKWEWLECESSPLPIGICTSICPPTGKPSPPCLEIWISELPAGRRALGPGIASYLRDQGLRASTVDTHRHCF